MKIVVAGAGKVGSSLVSQLVNEGHEITVVDRNTDVLEETMQMYDVIGVQGNAASMEALEEAGIRTADLLIAATDRDEVNLLSCLTAHGLNPDLHTIGRIRDKDYRAQAYQMRDYFALNYVINPEHEAAIEMRRLLNFPGFLGLETFAKGNVEIAVLKIGEDSALNGIKLSGMNDIVHCHVLVCAVQRNGECIIPDGNFVLRNNDLIYVTASSSNLSVLLKNLGIITRKVRSVLIAGGSLISYYLAKELESSGISSTIVEAKRQRCEELAMLLPNTRIIVGDASSQAFLDSVGIDDFDAMVTLTGLDELNIVISLYGNSRKVPHLITKLSHAENNRMLDSLPLGSVIAPKELVCSSIVRYVRAMQNKEGAAITIHRIADGQGEAIEFNVDKDTKYLGVPLKDMNLKPNVLIASITDGMNTEISTGNSKFKVGDNVIVVTNKTTSIRQLNDIFED
ncbi:MAG: Trk system potassium transporter TrkA [Solobacterium sp.]|nr:Trk system potassium transporter TrkA [Solobacterium sp.]